VRAGKISKIEVASSPTDSAAAIRALKASADAQARKNKELNDQMLAQLGRVITAKKPDTPAQALAEAVEKMKHTRGRELDESINQLVAKNIADRRARRLNN
jgi:hypothetical protein